MASFLRANLSVVVVSIRSTADLRPKHFAVLVTIRVTADLRPKHSVAVASIKQCSLEPTVAALVTIHPKSPSAVASSVAALLELELVAAVPKLLSVVASTSVELPEQQLVAVAPKLLSVVASSVVGLSELELVAAAPKLLSVVASSVVGLQRVGQLSASVQNHLYRQFHLSREMLLAGQHPDTFHKTALVLLPPHFASLHTSQPHHQVLLMLAPALLAVEAHMPIDPSCPENKVQHILAYALMLGSHPASVQRRHRIVDYASSNLLNYCQDEDRRRPYPVLRGILVGEQAALCHPYPVLHQTVAAAAAAVALSLFPNHDQICQTIDCRPHQGCIADLPTLVVSRGSLILKEYGPNRKHPAGLC